MPRRDDAAARPPADRPVDAGLTILTEPVADEGVVIVTHPGAIAIRSYRALAEQLDGVGLAVLEIDKIPEYRRSMLGGQPLNLTIAEVSRRFARLACEFAGNRPLCLLGWSFGGTLAYALAQELSQNRSVQHLFILDSIAPGPGNPGKEFGNSLPDREALDWFAMYFGARHGTPLGFCPADFEGQTLDEGLQKILQRCKQFGSMSADTSSAELRKVFTAFVDGIVRSKILHDGFDPAPPRWPVSLIRPERGLLDTASMLGWEQVMGGPVSIHRCSGDHYTMLTEQDPAQMVGSIINSVLSGCGFRFSGNKEFTNMSTIDGVDRTGRRLADDPIAIVGLSCLFPLAENKSRFWANIVDGRDCLDEVPESYWRIEDFYDPDPTAEDKTYCRRGGFIPRVDFDPLEFGIPPNILGVTGVLQLLSLGVARDVLRDAGCPDASWYDPSRTGVALGVTSANSLIQPLAARLQTPVLREVVLSCGLSDRDADEIVSRYKKAFAPWDENSFPGMLSNVVAGRITNRFDLGGANYTIDAACASSLAAVRAGVAELLERRADMMIVGGCDAENTILMYLCFSKTPALSRTEKIRPFDVNADGTMIGEGIGMLALKRLADAERDGDRIYSVLCGLGSSSDGRFKSIYAPRASGQALAIKRAYEDAACTPNDIDLLEAHGTGTVAGDATEIAALADVYTEAGCAASSVALGSVKSQIGHTKGAAGAAGLIKMSLALHHRILPPTINVETPNAALASPKSVFYPNVVARPWLPRTDGAPRRAAVSSFGFGGTNFHCVLQEHPTYPPGPSEHDVARVALWSAPDKEALVASMRNDEPADGGAIAADHARLALVHSGDDFAERRALAIKMLEADIGADVLNHPKGIFYRRTALAGSNRVAVAFPGQGSQHVNMGRTAALAVPEIRDAFAEANSQFSEDLAVGSVTFPAPAFSSEQRAAQEEYLRRTQYAQPAIGALSAGYFRHLRQLGLSPEAFIGHSYGELTALWAAEAITDDVFFRLSRARGAAMAQLPAAEADRGTMLSVKAPIDIVENLVTAHNDVFVCNLNAPAQIVVGGGTEAIRGFAQECERQGLQTRSLPVSAAFHTPYIQHTRMTFGGYVDEARIRAPKGQIYSNVAGAAYGPDEAANGQLLVRQLVEPVQFSSKVAEMYDAGIRVFVEVGPKHVLGDLIRANLGEATDIVAISTDNGHPETSDVELRKAIAQLLVVGVPLAGVNRHYQHPIRRPSPKTSFPLTGVNFVPDRRRTEYQEALAAPYSISVAPTADSASVAPAADTEQQLDVATVPHHAVAARVVSEVAEELLAVHRDFVEGQRELANRLSNVIGTMPNGTVDNSKASEIIAVTDHSVSVADTHRRVIEIVDEMLKSEFDSAALDFVADGTDATTAVGQLAAPLLDEKPACSVAEGPVGIPSNGSQPVSAMSALAVVTVNGSAPAVNGSGSSDGSAPPVNGSGSSDGSAPPVNGSGSSDGSAPPVNGSGSSDGSAPPVNGSVVDADRAQATLLDVVAEKTGYPREMLNVDLDVESDLGIDSVKRVEILGTVQKLLPHMPEVGLEQMAELRTLADIAGLISTASHGTQPSNDAQPVSVVSAPAANGSGSSDGSATPVNGSGSSDGSVPAVNGSVVDADRAQATLLDVVAEKTGYPREMLNVDLDVESDLGIDSVKRVEILGTVQKLLPHMPEVGLEQMAELRTLADIAGLISTASHGTQPSNDAQPVSVVSAPAVNGSGSSDGSATPVNGSGSSDGSVPAVNGSVVDADRAQATLLDVVAEKTGYPREMLNVDLDVESDLGIDSVKRVEILGTVQKLLPHMPEVGLEQMAELRTLADIACLISTASHGTQPSNDAQPVSVVSAPAVNGSGSSDGSATPVNGSGSSDGSVPAVNGSVVDADRAQATLLDVVAEKTGYPREMLNVDLDVESDLGIDSVKRVEILGTVQKLLPHMPEVGLEQMAELRTLADIAGLISTASHGTQPSNDAQPVSVVSAPAANGSGSSDGSATPVNGSVVDADRAQATLLDVVAEKTGYPREMLNVDLDVESDLGIDSVKRVEILGTVQKLLPHMPEVGLEQMAELRTLADIAGLISTASHGTQPSNDAQPVSVVSAPAVNGSGSSDGSATPVNGSGSSDGSVPAVNGSVVDADRAQATLLDVVAEKTGYPREMLNVDLDVESDLGIDSVKRVEILGTVQKLLPHMPEVGLEQMAELRTLADIAGLISTASHGTQPSNDAQPVSVVSAPAANGSGSSDGSATPVNGSVVDADRAQATLLDVVAEKTGYPREMLNVDLDVESDLGIDSVKRVEILGTVQKLLPHMPEVGLEQMAELRTLADIAGLISTASHGTQPSNDAQPVSVVSAPAANGSGSSDGSATPVNGSVVDADRAQATLLDVVAEKTGYPREMLNVDLDVESDLGIDSVKRVEILGTVQKLLPHMPEVGLEQMAELRTLADIAGLISTASHGTQPSNDAQPVSVVSAPAANGSGSSDGSAPHEQSPEYVSQTFAR